MRPWHFSDNGLLAKILPGHIAMLSSFVFLLAVAAVYAAFTKVAARAYRRSKLSWKSALVFGVVATLIGLIANLSSGTLPYAEPFGKIIIIAVGTLFLASQATDTAGQPVGTKGAIALSLIAVGIALVVGSAMQVLMPALPL